MAPPLPWGEVAALARDAAARALPQGGAAATRAALAVAEGALAQAPSSATALACKPGCDCCCHQVVGVTPAEADLLAEGLGRLGTGRQARIRRRAAEVAARGRGLDPRAWWAAKLACPLLAGGRCLVHAWRPLPCRAFGSADAGLCRRSLAGEAVRIPVPAAQFAIFGHAQAGLAQALADAGGDPGPFPLADLLADRPAGLSCCPVPGGSS